MSFKEFAALVTRRVDFLSKQPELFEVEVGQDLYSSYLESFPSGTNPIFRERTEHDCNTCKQFVRGMGAMVAIVNDQIETVWGGEVIECAPAPYKAVATALDALIRSKEIVSVYRTDQASYGTPSNLDRHDPSIVWTHLSSRVPSRCISSNVGTEKNRKNTAAQVLKRGLEEIRISDLKEVLDLIDSNSIYRGSDHRNSVELFLSLLTSYEKGGRSPLFHWVNSNNPAAQFRNTVIGTLLIDLSTGMDTEVAVKRFEDKVAPANYKRPKAIITQTMVKQAMATIEGLGLTDSLQRRYANLSDIAINDVLFVDNAAQSKMKGGIADLLLAQTKPVRISSSPTTISIDDFMSGQFKKVEVILTPDNFSNFVTLTAPVHADAPSLFQWGNGFGWSYDGDVTDSIKQKVKKAGGNVTNAVMRCSLAWYNRDDLDIHCDTPSGEHIYYGRKSGVLDVDMNYSTVVSDPVENLSWSRITEDGTYQISVNCWQRREQIDHGCTFEVEDDQGLVQTFSYEGRVDGTVHMLDLIVQGGKLVKVIPQAGVKSSMGIQMEKWGVKTGQPLLVTTIMKSPNHWEGTPMTGSLHWFFMLSGCACPQPSRGIYNEFLRSDLQPHKRVFEVLGSKTRCEGTDQLAGVGFTHARNDTVNVLADGRPYRIEF